MIETLLKELKQDEVFKRYLRLERNYKDDNERYKGENDSIILDLFCEYLAESTKPIFNNIYKYKNFFISFDIIYDEHDRRYNQVTDMTCYTKQKILEKLDKIKKRINNELHKTNKK